MKIGVETHFDCSNTDEQIALLCFFSNSLLITNLISRKAEKTLMQETNKIELKAFVLIAPLLLSVFAGNSSGYPAPQTPAPWSRFDSCILVEFRG